MSVNERVASGTPAVLAPIQWIDVDPPVMMTEAMGYIRVRVTLSDGRASHGTGSFDLSLTGNRAQATNPIEDCETSAIGRALAFLGYHSDQRIASREEVQEARRRASQPPRPQGPVPLTAAQGQALLAHAASLGLDADNARAVIEGFRDEGGVIPGSDYGRIERALNEAAVVAGAAA